MNKYSKLVDKIDGLMSMYVRDHDYVVRISDGEDLFKILKHGTDRAELSDKLWEPLTPVSFEINVKHEDVIIASTYEDLVLDAQLDAGTLKHKLDIIKYPLVVCYRRSCLDILYEEPKTDTQNQGIHFTFNTEKTEALIAVFKATVEEDYVGLEQIHMRQV